jgi:hypothetical protein
MIEFFLFSTFFHPFWISWTDVIFIAPFHLIVHWSVSRGRRKLVKESLGLFNCEQTPSYAFEWSALIWDLDSVLFFICYLLFFLFVKSNFIQGWTKMSVIPVSAETFCHQLLGIWHLKCKLKIKVSFIIVVNLPFIF